MIRFCWPFDQCGRAVSDSDWCTFGSAPCSPLVFGSADDDLACQAVSVSVQGARVALGFWCDLVFGDGQHGR
ncbi:hypothetical protein SBA3_2150021 [Candidatus Sulfopaludibacter sp. SbA3]|nr:hypothetical protein SBA3_2150021 [Candidatus Sulfopaludibacter sp. SbA3]